MAVGIECGSLDVSKISEDDILIGEGNKTSAWIRADVDEKIYVKPNEDPKNPYVVIKFSDACFATLCSDADLTDVNKSLLFFSAAVVSSLNNDQAQNNNPSGSQDDDKKAKTICGVDVAKLKEAQKRVDAASINEKGFQESAVIPAEAIVPMRSNIRTYGPYASSNFGTSCGGTQAEVNTDLCPWVFGSSQLMHAAGQELVNSSVIGLVRAETGSATVTGLPSFANLGAALAAGPNLTSINTTFGSSGITTNYEWRTYTPKLGGLSRAYIDRLKRVAKNRQENIKFLRSNTINQMKINRKLRMVNRAAAGGNPLAKAKAADKCLNRVLIGEIYDFRPLGSSSGQRTVVGTETLSKSVLEMRYDYEKKAFVSLDGLFGPVSINGASDVLPRFITPSGNIKHIVSPLHAQPPFTSGECQNVSTPDTHDQYNLKINNKYLNPLANPGDITHYDSESPSGSPGHAIDLVGRETTVPESGLITNFYSFDDPKRYSSDYRFLGMRGPIVLHAWGYDVDGKPIPNAIDTDADTKKGIFKSEIGEGSSTTGLKDEFMQDWLLKPGTWPVGPIDLRFDRERGVWVCPQPFKIVLARIIKEVPKCGEGVGTIINKKADKRYGKKLFNSKGEPLQEEPECRKTDYCDEGYTNPYQEDQDDDNCYKWILINIGACPSPTPTETYTPTPNPSNTPNPSTTPPAPTPSASVQDNLNITLSLENGKLVLTYTFNGVTKTTSVDTTTCEDGGSSSSSSEPTPTPTESTTPAETPSPTETPSETPTGTPTTTPTITPTASPSPTPTPTTSPTSTPTPTPSPPPEEELPIIKIVDRIGIKHNIGDMVYAYYDTYSHEYVVLETSRSSSEDNVIAYGYLAQSNSISVQGYSGPRKFTIGDIIKFENPLDLDIPTECYPVYAVIGRVNTC